MGIHELPAEAARAARRAAALIRRWERKREREGLEKWKALHPNWEPLHASAVDYDAAEQNRLDLPACEWPLSTDLPRAALEQLRYSPPWHSAEWPMELGGWRWKGWREGR